MQTDSTRRSSTLSQIPRGIWMLGFVSMFMDISSELIHSLLPMFLVTGLGASAMMDGPIESSWLGNSGTDSERAHTLYAGAGFSAATLFVLATGTTQRSGKT